MAILCGILYLFAGVVLLERPLLGAAGYTLFLTMLFFAVGIVRIAGAILHRFSGWGWAVLSGCVSVLLAVLIWRDYPRIRAVGDWYVRGNRIDLRGLVVGDDRGLAARQLPILTSESPA